MNCPNCHQRFLWGEPTIRAAINGHDKFFCRHCHLEIHVVEIPDVSVLLIAIRCWIIPLMLAGIPYELLQESPVLSGLGAIFGVAWALNQNEEVRFFLKLAEKDHDKVDA